MHMVVGLGNPGAEYKDTRHNAGYAVVNRLQAQLGGVLWQKKFKGEICEVRLPSTLGSGRVLLVKPLTYMNLSGECVRPAVDFFKIPPASIVVCHDDLDLPLGTVRIKVGGGHGGHNGLRSLHEHLGADYLRVRLGIGRPDGKGDRVVGHVLSGFRGKERDDADLMAATAADAVMAVLTEGPQKAMNRYNSTRS
jgi:PTH1 family peptidyl-tRNA hydrolase